MKRYNNLYPNICNIKNLILADKKARKSKKNIQIKEFDKATGCNLLLLQNMLLFEEFTCSDYRTFKIFEPKERLIYELPYYPDRIVHHAIINIMDKIWINLLTKDSYGNIKGRGIHKCLESIIKDINKCEDDLYCLKLDIKKYYPSIDNNILKDLLRKKIKDNKLLNLLDNIIDKEQGIPIGNYLSQYFANIYLSYFDHWLKEDIKVGYYYRYVDDIIILDKNKSRLHSILSDINNYLYKNLRLKIKENYQIFPTDKRLIDFLGYRFNKKVIKVRNKIKKNFIKSVKQNKEKSIPSYIGWIKHTKNNNLLKKYIKNGKDYKLQVG
jgi:RNA-directed DNA polymerase